MNPTLSFDPHTHQVTGPAGALSLLPQDPLAPRFLMLLEGQCLHANIAEVAHKYGLCRQRYYQLLALFQDGGLAALQPQKSGPKTNYRRTEEVVRQVLRYRYLDPNGSPEVIVQKLRQTHWTVSLRSVHRIIADYGLQKKTPHPQSQKAASPAASSKQRPARAPGTGRSRQRGTRGPATPGR